MSGQAERMHIITEKVSALLRRLEGMHGQIEELKVEARDHRKVEEVLKARIAQLEQENEVLRNAKPASAGAEAGTKQRIDELVNEIDRCLELLND